ncbi:Uncharacterised protein [Klebsiella pneumoniae]|nr:Uncharacterised protein [Klebsiella pneumoniae]
MVRQKCSGIRRSYLEYRKEEINKLSIVNATIDCFFVPFDDVNKFNDEFIESLKNEED